MGTSIRRTLAVVAACAALLGIGVVAATCGGRERVPPARIWVADPPPPPDAPSIGRPDVRLGPGGAVVEDWNATWFWFGQRAEEMQTGVQFLHPMSLVDRIRLRVAGVIPRTVAVTYGRSDEVISSGGTDWRAWDRAGDR